MVRFKKYFPLLVIVGLSITAWLSGLHHYFNLEMFKSHQKFLDLFIAQNIFLSVLIYVTIYIAIVALSIPGATFMTLIGGFLLGQLIGTVAAVLSATIGASILFLSAKLASTDLLSKKAGTLAKTMQKGFQENAFSYLLTLRLIPVFPFVIVNLVAALFQMPLRVFALATLIGIIPGSFIYAGVGVALREVINEPNFTLSLVLKPKVLIALTGLGVLSLLPILFKKHQKNF